jgi:hypothetical protein
MKKAVAPARDVIDIIPSTAGAEPESAAEASTVTSSPTIFSGAGA